MSTLTTLTVTVMNARGKPMFMNPRFLRIVVAGPEAGKMAVARHGKALIVTGVASPNSVTVDSTAIRVDLTNTRAAKLSDIGMVAKAKPTAEVSLPSEMPALVTKYKAAIKKGGPVWIENALKFTKDIVKREAMEIALGRKPEATPAKVAKAPKAKETKVDVNALAKALQEGGAEAGMAYLTGLAKDAK